MIVADHSLSTTDLALLIGTFPKGVWVVPCDCETALYHSHVKTGGELPVKIYFVESLDGYTRSGISVVRILLTEDTSLIRTLHIVRNKFFSNYWHAWAYWEQIKGTLK